MNTAFGCFRLSRQTIACLDKAVDCTSSGLKKLKTNPHSRVQSLLVGASVRADKTNLDIFAFGAL